MKKKVKKTIFLDYSILIPYLVLSVVGIIMSYSASSYRLMNQEIPAPPWQDSVKQTAFFLAGLVVITIIYKIKTEVLQNKHFIMFGISSITIMLLLTRFTPLGQEINGARGWLKLGPLTIQPTEFLKIVVVWYLAYIFSKREDTIAYDFKGSAMKPLALVGVLIGLVLIQPDTGGAAILVLITAILVFASGISYIYSLAVGVIGVVGSLFVVQLLSWIPKSWYPTSFVHVYGRFQSFKDPFVDAYGDGHQMVNSYYAIYRGGWFGQGLGNSVQKKGFLPEAHSDFMFSIIIEELGLIVAIILLLLLLFLTLRIILVGVKATTSFNSLMCIGIGGMLLIQTFVNVGGITGIIPLTGVTFPFLSQGGSSLLTLSIAIGFALNIRADERRKLEFRKEQHPNGNVVNFSRTV
ncbi:FtsW/RodA/SpoVE family cell cycle protein [Vagococcus fessus]|uniref:Probable peptidoglycan glycosyltransferase FtsW n=1 Tax=Vagococcus fessus TaxID=120370 RepID=A0A430ADF8_9ENTE|nr:FtsW/RodA/SpoVE family cell cycle protein [Vagococcus fessus]RSU05249.1 cell division protein FtsW [Vagococcus fessus]